MTPNELYPFQEEAIEKMNAMPHVLLFDDMGLGKSRQALEHVTRNKMFPCLIICPKTLVYNWRAEIKKWHPDEEPYIYYDTEALMDKILINPPHFFILWHDLFSKMSDYSVNYDELLEAVPYLRRWKSVIVDEAHVFRNPNTNRGESLIKFANSPAKKILLTGTPIVNSAMDLYPLLKVVGVSESQSEFLDRYCYSKNSPYGTTVSNLIKNKEELMEKIGHMWIRRSKKEVLTQLPERIEQQIELEMTPEQRTIYSRAVEMFLLEVETPEGDTISFNMEYVLPRLIRLRQLALEPAILNKSKSITGTKTEYIYQLLNNLAYDDKVVIFSNFKQYLDILKTYNVVPTNTVTISGDEDNYERQQNVEKFQKDKACKVCLITAAGGVGLTLTAANKIVIADRWWNEMVTNQAADRIYRIGQTRAVQVLYLNTVNSIDEHIRDRNFAKGETFSSLITSMREKGY